MTKLVADLSKEELNYWAAKVRRWTQHSRFYWKDEQGNTVLDGMPWEPATNGGQAMELAEKYDVSTDAPYKDDRTWRAMTRAKQRWSIGETLCEAICRAVIASHYGEEVSVSDEPEGVPDDE